MKSKYAQKQMMKTQKSKIWDSGKPLKREIQSRTSLPQETKETSKKQCNFTCKATRKNGKKKTPPKLVEEKKNITTREEINDKRNERDDSKDQ